MPHKKHTGRYALLGQFSDKIMAIIISCTRRSVSHKLSENRSWVQAIISLINIKCNYHYIQIIQGRIHDFCDIHVSICLVFWLEKEYIHVHMYMYVLLNGIHLTRNAAKNSSWLPGLAKLPQCATDVTL